MRYLSACVLLAVWASGCAVAHYYDEEGKDLPGMPFVWKDQYGKAHLAYVKTSTGLGQATFTLERTETGGYTRFTNNLDSTAVSEMAGSAFEAAFEAGKIAARAEIQERILRLEDDAARRALQRALEEAPPK